MKKNVSIRKAVEFVINAKDEKYTLLGIGPMSENFLRASLEISKEKDFPLMYIASRNQVDSYKLGGGYVFNSDQKLFREKIEAICDEIGYDNVYYLCRDHGGPWQRDKERADHLPEAEAMELAKESYKEDILNGFDLLHIDPTKDPDEMCKVVDIEVVFNRTVELIEYCEKVRKDYGIEKEIAYEVGTEETSGGLTSMDRYESFIQRIRDYTGEHGLPMPIFIVGQTGTLTRLTKNVGDFSYENAKELSRISTKYGVGLKEHNGDYLSEAKLLAHLPLEITAMNVAPAFGTIETMALLELLDVEDKFTELGAIASPSNLRQVMTHDSIYSMKWKKWLTGEIDMSDLEHLDENTRRQITELCGHYTYSRAEVEQEINRLYENLASLHIDGRRFVIEKLKEEMQKHVRCFNMEGLTTKIMHQPALCRNVE
ncbi:MAG: class II D-tagatose-bisphosphate aldolase, non-catalytic subunit [Clostridium sp.]|nr:class II D-tagatose-bisphosphate aldolase, non-catalytic subunit [Clostridium sp.]